MSGSQSSTQADGEVAIATATQTVSGWTDVAISGGLDMMPACFDLGLTETYPDGTTDITLKKGDACTITIGGDVVITGWINRVSRRVSVGQHSVRVQGRSRCQDLVDCSAMPKQMSINGATVGDLARTLAAPFIGPISVLLPDGEGDGKPYYFSVSLGETPWELMSQVASYEGLLMHDDARGDVVICRVGTTKTASGFAEGVNLQAFGVDDADDVLFSEYIPVYSAQDSLSLIGPGGNAAGAIVPDKLVTRYRPLIVISDQPAQGDTLAHQRAVWEATRRRGRSQSVAVTCDSWRDSAGTLWTHNVLAPLNVPTIGIANVEWIIASWAFIRNAERGTVADITLMSPDAFSVEPQVLLDTNRLINDAANADRARQAALGDNNNGAPLAATAPNALSGDNFRGGEGYGL